VAQLILKTINIIENLGLVRLGML